MKKLFAILMAALMVFTLVGCSGSKNDKKTVYIMGPTPDHGWTAQAGAFAERKAKEIKEAGTYNATYIPASSGEEQVDQCNQIVANGDAVIVVMMPIEDSAAAGQEALYTAGIPFISFDRIIEKTEKYAALNTSGDNYAVGAGIAYWFQQNGMKPGDTVVVLYGDNGTVSGRRFEGFETFLEGTKAYEDEKKGSFNTTEKWTADQVKASTGDYSAVCDWSADKAVEYLDQKFTEIIDKATANNGRLFIFSMDDEMTFGVLTTLQTKIEGTDYAKKTEDLQLYISSIGGMQQMYDVMSGKDATNAATANKYFDGVMNMYFSPQMMNAVIDEALAMLAGTVTHEVGSSMFTKTFMVLPSEAGSIEGFLGNR